MKTFLHVTVLFSFAVTQPLYDILSRNSEFFSIRNHSSLEVILLVTLFSFVIPLLLCALLIIVRLVNDKASKILNGLLIFILLYAFFLLVVNNIFYSSVYFILSVPLIISSLLTYFYYKREIIKEFITYLSPAILIFPLLFVFNSPVYYVIFPPVVPNVKSPDIKSTAPIVMIIFDELPLSSLMIEGGKLDEKMFPGFVELAQNSIWYPNTTSIAEYTINAVPSILTGNIPRPIGVTNRQLRTFDDWSGFPSYDFHPKNIFTAFKKNYSLNVFETITNLCPYKECIQNSHMNVQSMESSYYNMLKDLSYVYMHILAPRSLIGYLPAINMGWLDLFSKIKKQPFRKEMLDIDKSGNSFNQLNNKTMYYYDDYTLYNKFISSINKSSKPALYFHHTTLPHKPWNYTSLGNRYDLKNLSRKHTKKLSANANNRLQYQRYLLQLTFVDKLLQDTVKKLKKTNLFDEALIIVTADHGASFKYGTKLRDIDKIKKTYHSILNIPLFIKHPGQSKMIIDNRHMQTIDILPTIFKVLNEQVPWNMDGVPAEIKQNKKKVNTFYIDNDTYNKNYFSFDPAERIHLINDKNQLFGKNGRVGLYGGANHGNLIYKQVKNISCARKLNNVDLFTNKESFEFIDFASGNVPSVINGIVQKDSLDIEGMFMIAINGKVASVLAARDVIESNNYFTTIVDEKLFMSRDNKIDFYVINKIIQCKNI